MAATAIYNTRNRGGTESRAPTGELFSLKVMRFPQPQMRLKKIIAGEDIAGAGTFQISDRKFQIQDPFSSSLGLVLDKSKVYLGESSRMCVIIKHNSAYTVSAVGVRIEVQTQKSRQILVDTIQSPQDLKAGQTMDYFLTFKLSDAGENALVCCVFYRDEDNQIRNFQKFFRFAVDEPIRVDTKLVNKKNLTLARMAIKNISDEPILIHKLDFRPCPDVKVVDNKNSDLIGDTGTMIDPNAVTCATFSLLASSQLSGSTELGSIEIQWKRAGHTGISKTKALLKPADGKERKFGLKIIEAPDRIYLEKAFTVTVEIECFSEIPIHVRLSVTSQKHLSIVPAGIASQSCGEMKAKEKKRLKLVLLPLALGIQRISGFKLSCKELGYAEEFDNLQQFCVLKSE